VAKMQAPTSSLSLAIFVPHFCYMAIPLMLLRARYFLLQVAARRFMIFARRDSAHAREQRSGEPAMPKEL